MNRKPRILVVGSSNTDMIIRLDRIPRPGETILGGEFAIAAGGKGANQAVAAARAGGHVTFVARVGRDIFGEQALAGFVEDGIDVGKVVRDAAEPSGVALIFVAKDGENSIAVASGANARLAPADVGRAAAAFGDADVLVLQLETALPTVRKAVALAAASGVRVILNPAPARDLPSALLGRVSILTPNESEAERLSGIKVSDEFSAARAAATLRRRGVETVVITLGARGAYVNGPGERRLVPGFKVKPVDTTAAGDVFNGALAVALAEGKALADAVRFANAAAALSVTKRGAQPSAPRRREIVRFLKARG
jgi:ribokinase